LERVVIIGRNVGDAVERSTASDVSRGGDGVLPIGCERVVSSRDFFDAVGGPVDGQTVEVSPDRIVWVFVGTDGGVY
jgi:hypothetical protein